MARGTVFGVSVIGFALACATAGCENLLGVDFGSAELRSPPGSADASASCVPLVPPARPANMAKATDNVEFVAVIRHVDFGDTAPDAGQGGYFDVGYDQDGLCTGRYGNGPACKPLSWIGEVPEDGPQGQDDSIALLMLNQYKVFGISAVGSTWENDDLAKGVDSPVGVLRVRAFSGLGNDDHLEVDWFDADPLGSGTDGGIAPAFDESDQWPVRSDGVANPSAGTAAGTVSLYRDGNAFELRGTIVAHFPTLRIPMRNTRFDLTDVTVTAEAVRDPVSGKWSIPDGMMGGRAVSDSVLHGIPTIAYNAFGVALCPSDQANYPGVKRFVCASADLPASGKADPSVTCSASSIGMRFTTAPASLGKIVVPAPQPAFCPANADPSKDTCATEQSP